MYSLQSIYFSIVVFNFDSSVLLHVSVVPYLLLMFDIHHVTINYSTVLLMGIGLHTSVLL